jgi:hypothetical protein
MPMFEGVGFMDTDCGDNTLAQAACIDNQRATNICRFMGMEKMPGQNETQGPHDINRIQIGPYTGVWLPPGNASNGWTGGCTGNKIPMTNNGVTMCLLAFTAEERADVELNQSFWGDVQCWCPQNEPVFDLMFWENRQVFRVPGRYAGLQAARDECGVPERRNGKPVAEYVASANMCKGQVHVFNSVPPAPDFCTNGTRNMHCAMDTRDILVNNNGTTDEWCNNTGSVFLNRVVHLEEPVVAAVTNTTFYVVCAAESPYTIMLANELGNAPCQTSISWSFPQPPQGHSGVTCKMNRDEADAWCKANNMELAPYSPALWLEFQAGIAADPTHANDYLWVRTVGCGSSTDGGFCALTGADGPVERSENERGSFACMPATVSSHGGNINLLLEEHEEHVPARMAEVRAVAATELRAVDKTACTPMQNGTKCYIAVMNAKNGGIASNPGNWGDLTPDSTPEEIQAYLAALGASNPTIQAQYNCSMPCHYGNVTGPLWHEDGDHLCAQSEADAAMYASAAAASANGSNATQAAPWNGTSTVSTQESCQALALANDHNFYAYEPNSGVCNTYYTCNVQVELATDQVGIKTYRRFAPTTTATTTYTYHQHMGLPHEDGWMLGKDPVPLVAGPPPEEASAISGVNQLLLAGEDDLRLLAACADGMVRMFSTKTNKPVAPPFNLGGTRTVEAYTVAVAPPPGTNASNWTVAGTADAPLAEIYAGGSGGKIRSWEVELLSDEIPAGLDPVGDMPEVGWVTDIVVDAEAGKLYAATEGGEIGVWQTNGSMVCQGITADERTVWDRVDEMDARESKKQEADAAKAMAQIAAGADPALVNWTKWEPRCEILEKLPEDAYECPNAPPVPETPPPSPAEANVTTPPVNCNLGDPCWALDGGLAKPPEMPSPAPTPEPTVDPGALYAVSLQGQSYCPADFLKIANKEDCCCGCDDVDSHANCATAELGLPKATPAELSSTTNTDPTGCFLDEQGSVSYNPYGMTNPTEMGNRQVVCKRDPNSLVSSQGGHSSSGNGTAYSRMRNDTSGANSTPGVNGTFMTPGPPTPAPSGGGGVPPTPAPPDDVMTTVAPNQTTNVTFMREQMNDMQDQETNIDAQLGRLEMIRRIGEQKIGVEGDGVVHWNAEPFQKSHPGISSDLETARASTQQVGVSATGKIEHVAPRLSPAIQLRTNGSHD